MKYSLTFSAMILLFLAGFSHGQIKMATAIIPPYQEYGENNELRGYAIPMVECIMKQLEQPYSIQVYPWLRAQKTVRNEENDAFFVASENDSRSEYATISDPLFDGTRSWYIRPDFDVRPGTSEFSETAFVGAVFGTNMHAWLKKEFKNVITKETERELITLLATKRVDAVLLTDLMYESVSKKLAIGPNAFQKVIAKQHPLGVYFGHHFLKQNEGFLAKFNQAIPSCRKAMP